MSCRFTIPIAIHPEKAIMLSASLGDELVRAGRLAQWQITGTIDGGIFFLAIPGIPDSPVLPVRVMGTYRTMLVNVGVDELSEPDPWPANSGSYFDVTVQLLDGVSCDDVSHYANATMHRWYLEEREFYGEKLDLIGLRDRLALSRDPESLWSKPPFVAAMAILSVAVVGILSSSG